MALSLWASPDTALADHRSRRAPVFQHRHHRHGPRVAPRHYGHPGRFVVPPRIHSHRLQYYRPYYHGRVYFAPHRHHHFAYQFPYYGPYGFVEFRPYYYCGDDLFVHG
ncbi:MAG: hypothetical protein HY509_04645, partial [Acidobacteria bacterium]|nr:hypothetical protein [Acidobacteriota bacterium]